MPRALAIALAAAMASPVAASSAAASHVAASPAAASAAAASPAGGMARAAAAGAPAVRIEAGPEGRTSERQPLFRFGADAGAASVDCRIVALDDDEQAPAFHPCIGVDLPAAPLADGDYRFEVRALDADGRAGPIARRPFTVQRPLTPPPPVVRPECRASLATLRAARRAVVTGQRSLARAQATERRARARRARRALQSAIRRRTTAQRRLARAGERLTSAQQSAERRCR